MILSVLMMTGAISYALLAVYFIVGISLYDTRAIRRKQHSRQHPHARIYRTRPLISIIVIASQNEHALRECLDSILKSTYRKREIIIVNKFKHPIPKHFLKELKAQKLTIMTSRQTTVNAATTAYRRYGNGELVMVMNGESTVETSTLRSVVAHFNSRKGLAAVILQKQLMPVVHITDLFENYTRLLGYFVGKFRDAFGSLSAHARTDIVFNQDGFAALYNKKDDQSKSKIYHDVAYADDAHIHTLQARSLRMLILSACHTTAHQLSSLLHPNRLRSLATTYFSVTFTLFSFLAIFCLPIILGYFLYIAVFLHQPVLFLIYLANATLVLLLVIWWGGNHLKTRKKLAYSLLIPVTYGRFFLLSCVASLASLRNFIPYRSRQD